MKTKKIIVAGALVREVLYTRASSREPATVRAAKRKTSTEAQQRLNARLSWEKLELMIAANFVPGDLVATLTFDDEHLPPDRKAASARLKKFRAELGRIRKEAGEEELRMIWTIENKAGAGRWHVHCVMNSTGNDFGDVLRCWPYGGDCEITRLRTDKEKNYETLARYMCKEARERSGLRSWSYTRNCRKPEVETFLVPDDTTLDVPEGATVYVQEAKKTEWAAFEFVKYLACSPVKLRKKTTRRRRKR